MSRYRTIALVMLAVAAAYLLFASDALRGAIGRETMALFKPLLVQLVILIVDPAFVYVSAALMTIAAIAICLVYWFSVVRPSLRDLRGLSLGIANLRLPDARRPEERHDALKSLGDLLRRQHKYLAAWALFQSHAAAAGRLPEHPFSYFAASDPDNDYINHRGFMAALPGYFTSVGLLLTFLGLVVALYFASKGFQSGGLDDARVSIQQLLNASSFKFMTSVAALGCALLISVVHRLGQSLLRTESARTVATIEAYISVTRDVERAALGHAEPAAAAARDGDLADAIAKLSAEVQRLAARLDSPSGTPVHAG